MNKISSAIKNYKIGTVEFKSQRDELVSKFTTKINEQRENTKWKPITKRTVAILVNKHPNLKSISDLHAFYKKCDTGKNFNSCFFYFVKLSTD